MLPCDSNAPPPSPDRPADPDDLFAALMRKDRLIVELKEAMAARDGRIAALERAVAEAQSGARVGGPGGLAMPPPYLRMLSDRAGMLAESLSAIEAELLSIVSPADSIQRRLAALFAMPSVEGRIVQPHEEVCPSWSLSFEASASVRLDVRPKPAALPGLAPQSSSIEIALCGTTRWLALETPLAWNDIRDAARFEASAAGEPDRTLDIYLCARLWQLDGGFFQHFFGALKLDPQHRRATATGRLNLPDLTPFDFAQPPILLFFFSPEDGLCLRLDNLILSFV